MAKKYLRREGNFFNPVRVVSEWGGIAPFAATEYDPWSGKYSNYTDDELYDDIRNRLSADALAYWDSLDPTYRESIIKNNYTDNVENIANWWGLAGDITEVDIDDLIADLENVLTINGAMPTAPNYDDIVNNIDNDPALQRYLAELQTSEDRQTQIYQDQLRENQMMFDDYRSQILGNQYQQNAQLMGTVGSEMSKARRNALEAGASAGLRMAENINTSLALQNKQSQLSLETSNQLAQQLLNQRQAAAGIRGDYNSMLSANSAERRNARKNAADERYNREYSTYQDNLTNWEDSYNSSDNPFAENYKQQVRNKTTSQYGGGK